MAKSSAVFGLPIPTHLEAPDMPGAMEAYTKHLEKVLTAIAAESYFKGAIITAETDLKTLEPAVYVVSNIIIAKALGLPAQPGTLTVSAYAENHYYLYQSIESIPHLYTSNDGVTWNLVGAAWMNPTPLTGDDDIDALTPGAHPVSNVNTARALGLPDEYPGIIEDFPVGSRGGLQLLYSLKTGAPTYRRAKVNNMWGAWEAQGAPAPAVEISAVTGLERREILRQGLLARKGGKIGTSGKGVIALRFDDAPAEFREKALPLLKELALPFARVTTSASIHDDVIDPAEFPLMQTYCLENGGEVWNHGADHKETTGEAAEANLIGALAQLREAMPLLPIDCFAPPGGGVSYDGNMPSKTAENWATEIGHILLSHHALVSGYFPNSYYRPLDGVLRDSQNHYSVDAYNYDRVKQLVDRARDWHTGVVLMWHMNNPGTEGKMSLEDFEAALRYIAAQRDAGNILVLTKSGLGVADASTSWRDDLLATHEGEQAFSERIIYPQYRQQVPGSTRELTATVTGSPGATVTSSIAGMSREHTIPGGGTLMLRHLVTIPTDVDSTLTVSINAPCTDVHCYAV